MSAPTDRGVCQQMNRLYNFFVGFGSIFSLFPQSRRIDYGELAAPPFHDSVTSALQSDWKKVGLDIQSGIQQYERELAERP